MGLIKAITGAVGGVLADQWKEFFYCDSIDKEVLCVKGQKRVSGRSSNTKGEDNIISNGSGIAVADGQCMIIVEQGKVVEFCAEPGEFTWNNSTEPSLFAGKLGESIIETFKLIGKRFTFGGDTAKDQRVYYFNTKEILGNKFGTPSPIPFHVVVNQQLGFDLSVDLRCNGIYSYRITDPLLFYTNVCGNVVSEYRREEIDETLKSSLLDALQPALGSIAEQNIKYYQIPSHTKEVGAALMNELRYEWKELRGVELATLTFNSVTIPDDQRKKITEWEEIAMTTSPQAGAARLVGAQAEAMKAAAANEGGAMTGFMGMGMAMNAGGVNAQNLYAMGAQQSAPSAPATGTTWKCACGNTASGNFCGECGAKRPETGWTCSCGNVNKGKFCTECGAKKPTDAPLYKCDKCGWEPEDPHNPPKFCPECGDPFNDSDIK